MANITADIVKELRDKTGAGMMDCKKALTQSEGDIEKAIEFLRKSGIAKAEKKSGRATKEGKVFFQIEGNTAAMVEVLCETDFAASNEKFTTFVKDILARTMKLSGNGDVTEKVQEAEKDNLVEKISVIGENMQIRRAARWETAGQFGSYLHQGGRVGVLVDVEGACDQSLLGEICMHIAAFRPQYICPACVSPEIIEKEKEIAAAQLKDKPANMIEKIVMGKLNKWYTEVCLVKQPWIKDDKTSLDKVNPNIKVKRFLRWEVGEEL